METCYKVFTREPLAGIEIKEERVRSCIEKGLSVLQGDINIEILDYLLITLNHTDDQQLLQIIHPLSGKA